jgi:tRNA pseudouridine-54 N-methylase
MSFPIISYVPNAIDIMGQLDRLLSEFLILANHDGLDEADAQTVKHHADDLIGVGNKVHEILRERGL